MRIRERMGTTTCSWHSVLGGGVVDSEHWIACIARGEEWRVEEGRVGLACYGFGVPDCSKWYGLV